MKINCLLLLYFLRNRKIAQDEQKEEECKAVKKDRQSKRTTTRKESAIKPRPIVQPKKLERPELEHNNKKLIKIKTQKNPKLHLPNNSKKSRSNLPRHMTFKQDKKTAHPSR